MAELTLDNLLSICYIINELLEGSSIRRVVTNLWRKRRVVFCDRYIARKAYFGRYNLGLCRRNLGTG